MCDILVTQSFNNPTTNTVQFMAAQEGLVNCRVVETDSEYLFLEGDNKKHKINSPQGWVELKGRWSNAGFGLKQLKLLTQ